MRRTAAPTWTPAALDEAVATYRRTGERSALLSVIGAANTPRPLIAVQAALRAATSRRQRDALEDVADELSGGMVQPRAEYVASIIRACAAQYGPLLPRLVDVPAFVRGFVTAAAGLPPVAPMVAAIGVEAARRAPRGTLTIGAHDRGQTVAIYRTHCGDCGGRDGGQGYQYCAPCRARAGLAGDEAAIRARTAQLGCAQCAHEPVRPCGCRLEVAVPPDVTDGMVLAGRDGADGAQSLVVVRVD